MSDRATPPTLKHYPSPVDYEAWEKGYMPPSEHILIDQLAYRNAKVVTAMDHGDSGAVWLVLRGGNRKAACNIELYKMLVALIEPELAAEFSDIDAAQADPSIKRGEVA